MNELLFFIKERFNITISLDSNTPLISSGLIDSFKVTDLLAALEKKYKVKVSPSDVGVDNFDTVEQIYQFIQRRS